MSMTLVAEPLTVIPASERVVLDTTDTTETTRTLRRSSRIGDALFRSTATAPAWLLLRVWLGFMWFTAGWEKLVAHGNASWFGKAPALVGFVQGADASWANRAKAFGHPAVHYAWFLNFLHFVGSHAWLFGPIVVVSELLIGIGLITCTLTRWAAFGGVALNLMYVFGGSAGVNGLFILLGLSLMCAWQVAGHFGGDGLVRRLRSSAA
jgi:thiosulfate dehydrogenase [quinone] large subunit